MQYFFDKNNNKLNINLVLSFSCPETKKDYVIINNQEKLFNSASNYNNLEILEMASHSGSNIKLQEIPDSDWQAVQNFVFENICGKIKTSKI
jgi:uncharacterized protein YrzB (UPF0473 family)